MRRGVGTLYTSHHKYQPIVFENATTTEIRNLVHVDDLTVATSFVYQSWVCSVACEIVNSISECILYMGKVLENLDCNNYLLAFLPLQLEVCCLRVDSKGILLIRVVTCTLCSSDEKWHSLGSLSCSHTTN